MYNAIFMFLGLIEKKFSDFISCNYWEIPGVWNDNPLQYSMDNSMENSMDRSFVGFSHKESDMTGWLTDWEI